MENTEFQIGRTYSLYLLPSSREPVRAIFAGENEHRRTSQQELFCDFLRSVPGRYSNTEFCVYSVSRGNLFFNDETIVNANTRFPLVTTFYDLDSLRRDFPFLFSSDGGLLI